MSDDPKTFEFDPLPGDQQASIANGGSAVETVKRPKRGPKKGSKRARRGSADPTPPVETADPRLEQAFELIRKVIADADQKAHKKIMDRLIGPT